MLTPAFNHLLCFILMGCTKKVSKLINHPIVSLLGTRMGGTSTEVITQCKLSATTNRKRLLRNRWFHVFFFSYFFLGKVHYNCRPLYRRDQRNASEKDTVARWPRRWQRISLPVVRWMLRRGRRTTSLADGLRYFSVRARSCFFAFVSSVPFSTLCLMDVDQTLLSLLLWRCQDLLI